jgi:hypothetical protein
MARSVLIAVTWLVVGCAVPRSVIQGQTAAAIGAGGAEVGLASGIGIRRLSGSNVDNTSVNFPVVEGNAQAGLTDMLSFNLHLSPAGLQPGVKVTLVDGPLALAVLPQVAGLLSTGNQSSSGGTTTTSTIYGIMGGARLLLSHTSGPYGGVGYDLQYVTSQDNNGSSQGSATSHALTFALGFDLKAGGLRVRPELSVLYSPSNEFASSGGSARSNVPELQIIPNVTLAAAAK